MSELSTFSDVEIREYSELESAFLKSASILRREYLNELMLYQVKELPDILSDKKMSDYARFYNLTKLVYNKEESFIEKLTTIARTAHICNYSLVTIISSDGGKTEFWIGSVNKGYDTTMTIMMSDTLEGSIDGNFPGSRFSLVNNDVVDRTLRNIENSQDYSVVSSISNVASLRDEEQGIDKFIQGIEKLIDSLQGKKYSLITIADPISNQEKSVVQNSLEQLYSQLSGFASTEMSMNENSSVSTSNSYSESFSQAISTNTSISQSHTNQTGWSTSDSYSEGKTTNMGAVAVAVAGVAAAGLTVATGGLAAVAGAAIAGTAASATATAGAIGASAIVGAGSVAGSLMGTKSKTQTTSQSKSGSQSDTTNHQEGRSKTSTDTKTESETQSNTLGAGQTLSFSVENKTVKSILEDIDVQIGRLKDCGNYGSFSSCTYILSEDINVNMLASSLFNALISGENSNIQTATVNSWGIDGTPEDETNVASVKRFLSKLTHPRFSDLYNEMEFTPASLVSGKELSIQMGFPKRSIQGLSVVYKVPFGRNVISASDVSKPLSVGKLYNLGKTDTGLVNLDLNSLTSHLFVTGSTGTGKSNTVYKLLEQITKMDPEVHFMVVEPAKGEYKHAFYKHPRIKTEVYGTNPKKMKLLRINPFSFPEDIHVLEHIDRIVEILNVCWPMYAAMPAILKNAVIKSYEKCGWDITNSYVPGKQNVYPCFADVLECINEILDSSAFSQDNKGDYTGALCTRVESLTTGINGLIFTSSELTNEELFDRNVIVDLGRVGAVETKSLLMGILVMKLQEYRIASGLQPNQGLRHIMVLEEAHNLLKKTSTEQSADSSNLTGKSVEMITNAIAEMRTYGQSFFVVDQAPNLLDTAVIRNTNTKIVLCLPEDQDRDVVGKSMALSSEQIQELAKLEKGCAAVYQNDWEEAVLCLFEQYHKDPENLELDDLLFEYECNERILSQSQMKRDVLKVLLDIAIDENHRFERDEVIHIEKNILDLAISHDLKRKIKKVINDNSKHSLDEIAGIVTSLYECNGVVEKSQNSSSVEEWNETIIYNINPQLRMLPDRYRNIIVQCVFLVQARKDETFEPYLEKWVEYMNDVEVK